MGDPFWNSEDAQAKLSNTICFWKDIPYRVLVGDGIRHNKVLIKSLINLDEPCTEVDYTDDAFDYSSRELGWYRKSDYTAYLCRRPGRFNNAGLLDGNLDTYLGNASFYSMAMYECLLGIHPSYAKVHKDIWSMPRESSLPFHRHFSLKKISTTVAGIYQYNTNLICLVDKKGIISDMCLSERHLLKKIGVL